MINLIPPAARKSIIREYWLRVMAVWMFLFGTGFLIVSTLLLPTYVQILIQKGGITENHVDTSDRMATYDGLMQELLAAGLLADILTGNASSTLVSHYIENIERESGSAVTINAYTYLVQSSGDAIITIAGIADSRQALAAFRDALSSDSQYYKVELPISNLIKERDLLFSMKLYLATSTPII